MHLRQAFDSAQDSEPRPLIGLTGRLATGERIGAPRAFASAQLEIYFSEYAQNVWDAGGMPIHIPFVSGAPELVGRLDGLIIAGGEDINPVAYGQDAHPSVREWSDQRDALELGLVHAALDRGVPILGICRGLQLLNVARGGTLVQDLVSAGAGEHASAVAERTEQVHAIEIDSGSVFSQLYGQTSMRVNSFHHQAIDTVGDHIRVVARSSDGVIEAIEFEDAQVIAAQWHPEVHSNDPIFGWLVSSSRAFMSRHRDEPPFDQRTEHRTEQRFEQRSDHTHELEKS